MNNIIITGEKGSGKTTSCLRLIEMLRENGVAAGGVLTIAKDPRTFYLVREHREIPFEAEPGEPYEQIGRFRIHRENLALARTVVSADIGLPVLFIDEIGILEQKGRGFFGILEDILMEKQTGLVLIIRENLVEWFQSRLPALKGFELFKAAEKQSDKNSLALYKMLITQPA